MKKWIVLVLALLILCSCSKEEESNVISCVDFYKNNYKIIFYSDNEKLSEMNICPLCDKVEDLPIPDKKGFVFNGWYYDELFLTKVEGNTTSNITPNIKRSVNGCDESYNDINLYALWIEK